MIVSAYRQDLKSFLIDNLLPNREKCVHIIMQVAEALRYSHEKGIIHRDLKPANIMITKNGKVKVTDFGIAKIENINSDLTQGATIGTPKYMSPEHLQGKVTQQSDIFSLGIIFYEMLAGRVPFEGNTIPEIYCKVSLPEFKPESLRTIDSEICQELEDICFKAIDKNSIERYQNMEVLLQDLQNYQCRVSNASMKTPSSKEKKLMESNKNDNRMSKSSKDKPQRKQKRYTKTIIGAMILCFIFFMKIQINNNYDVKIDDLKNLTKNEEKHKF